MGAEEPPEDRRRFEELLRVNAELSAEIRLLASESPGALQVGQATAARRLAKLLAERDSLVAERDSLVAELDSTRAELSHVRADRAGLERQSQELAAEVARLSGGVAGFLRRLRGRLLSR